MLISSFSFVIVLLEILVLFPSPVACSRYIGFISAVFAEVTKRCGRVGPGVHFVPVYDIHRRHYPLNVVYVHSP